jgi:hypothetical protein
VIHADNDILHCVKTVTQVFDHKSLRRARYPPYWPDLAPSDFWLFKYLKGVLQGRSFDEPDELLSVLPGILRKVDRETLDAVFQEWMTRLQNGGMKMLNMLSDSSTEIFHFLF